MTTTSTPGDPTVEEGFPPDPPASEDNGGGDHREEHKLRLMLALSYFIWARVLIVANLAELPKGYAQELIEELESEGLALVGYKEFSRSMHFIERIVHRRRFAMGEELTASLTEKGRAHPELVKLSISKI